MGPIIQYVADMAPWIYAVCGFIALTQLYRAWQVRTERRQAVFSLEREKAMGDLYKIFLTAVILLVAMGSTYFFSTTLAGAVDTQVAETANPDAPVLTIPTLTPTALPPTPTPTITPTPLPVEAAPVEVEPVVVEQPVVVAEPTATPVPAVVQPTCADGRSVIVSPGVNQTVSGPVTVQGTATHEDFWYYKLEFTPGNGANANFAWFDGGENQVRNGYLGTFNSGAVANGTYTLRVVSVDTSGNFPSPCLVTINVQN